MLLHLEVSPFLFKPYISATLRLFSATVLPIFPILIFLNHPVSHRREAALFLALSLILSSIGLIIFVVNLLCILVTTTLTSEERLIRVLALVLVTWERARVILSFISSLADLSCSCSFSVSKVLCCFCSGRELMIALSFTFIMLIMIFEVVVIWHTIFPVVWLEDLLTCFHSFTFFLHLLLLHPMQFVIDRSIYWLVIFCDGLHRHIEVKWIMNFICWAFILVTARMWRIMILWSSLFHKFFTDCVICEWRDFWRIQKLLRCLVLMGTWCPALIILVAAFHWVYLPLQAAVNQNLSTLVLLWHTCIVAIITINLAERMVWLAGILQGAFQVLILVSFLLLLTWIRLANQRSTCIRAIACCICDTDFLVSRVRYNFTSSLLREVVSRNWNASGDWILSNFAEISHVGVPLRLRMLWVGV